MTDHAPQPPNPPSRYKGRCDVHGLRTCDVCQFGETDAKLLVAAEARIAALEAQLAEAQARLAEVQHNGELAVSDLLIVASALAQQKCQCVTTLGAHTRCDRCAAMDVTAASVAQHTAEVERRGAAKELRDLAQELRDGARVIPCPPGAREWRVTYADELCARAAELEGA